jgi:hypothetical protein
LLASPANATILFVSGFEMQSPQSSPNIDGLDLSNPAGTSPYVTTPVHSGGRALQLAATNVYFLGNNAADPTNQVPASTTTMSCRMYVYFPADGSSLAEPSFAFLLDYRAGGTTGFRSGLVASGSNRFMQISSSGAGFSTTVGTINIIKQTWYRIDFVYDAGLNGVGKIYVNGVLDVNTTHTGTNGAITIVAPGGSAGGTTIDDVRCDDGLSVVPDGKVITRTGKAGTATDTGFTLSGCTTIDECWSETPPSTTKTANSGSTTSAVAQTMLLHGFSTTQTGFGSETLTGSEILTVGFLACIAKTSLTTSGGNAGNLRWYINGAGPTDTAKTINTVDHGYKSSYATTPPSVANLDLMEIGWKKDASAAARTQTVTDCWYNIEYTLSTGHRQKSQVY